MLSGIGPADHLKAIGIPPILDLAGVGHNLQDHLLVAVAYRCTQPVTLASARTIRNLLTYVLFKTGPFTSNIAEAGGHLKTKPDLSSPDLPIFFAPAYFINHGFTQLQGHGFTIASALIRPQSRGRITLRSSNPFEPPAIQPNYLASQADLHVLLEGVKLARRLAEATAFNAFRGAEVYPGSQAQIDEAVCDYIRNNAETCYHPVGTCRMGDDPLAVVDARLRVHGIESLRVVDASIMPTIVSGNTNAPTIMIAEKATDLIKADA
jgi:choline dehydrogenase